MTLGERVADRVAAFGGSWKFIGIFFAIMATWIAFNLTKYAFDAPPFILFNLILSMLAAIQAPIIMMSQNRQNDRDRAGASADFAINQKAETEVAMLCREWQKLLEIQQTQIEMLKKLGKDAS